MPLPDQGSVAASVCTPMDTTKRFTRAGLPLAASLVTGKSVELVPPVMCVSSRASTAIEAPTSSPFPPR